MKQQLLLLVLFSMVLCSPFFRKLEDEEVTEESCKKLGKKYKEVTKYKCKTGGSDFIVDNKDDCKSGTWIQTAQCSATEVSVDKCSGTPKFTETEASGTCMLGDVEISSLTSKGECENALVWTEGKCSISGIKDSTICTTTSGVWTPTDDAKGDCTDGTTDTTKSACEATVGRFTSNSTTIGTCSNTEKSNKGDCEGAGAEWTPNDDNEGTCTIGSATKKSDCINTYGEFTLTEKNKGSCSISGKADKDSCEAAKGEWTNEHCSVTQFNSAETCKGTPKFTKKGECKLNNIVISSRTTQETCEVALKVEEAGCSNKEVKKQEDCEAEAKVDGEVKVGECGDDIGSNSNFLKAINFALFAICLLF